MILKMALGIALYEYVLDPVLQCISVMIRILLDEEYRKDWANCDPNGNENKRYIKRFAQYIQKEKGEEERTETVDRTIGFKIK